MASFRPHHVSLTVTDLNASKSFYAYFGFRPVVEWSKKDQSVVIAHLSDGDGFIIELFQYADGESREFTSGNNLPELGVKHVCFGTDDIHAARTQIMAAGIGRVTEIARGRTLTDYFFVLDPDGMFVEIAQDGRSLDPESPLILTAD